MFCRKFFSSHQVNGRFFAFFGAKRPRATGARAVVIPREAGITAQANGRRKLFGSHGDGGLFDDDFSGSNVPSGDDETADFVVTVYFKGRTTPFMTSFSPIWLLVRRRAIRYSETSGAFGRGWRRTNPTLIQIPADEIEAVIFVDFAPIDASRRIRIELVHVKCASRHKKQRFFYRKKKMEIEIFDFPHFFVTRDTDEEDSKLEMGQRFRRGDESSNVVERVQLLEHNSAAAPLARCKKTQVLHMHDRPTVLTFTWTNKLSYLFHLLH